MQKTKAITYEEIYFELMELSKRYSAFTSFRVLGESHDQRMIPMIEIGKGDYALFCVSGIWGIEQVIPEMLVNLAKDYCKAYESKWIIEDFYDIKELLDSIKICIIPILNPDGYEIFQNGYQAIHNPIHRQMLKMQNIPYKEFKGNARGINIGRNFPTLYYKRKRTKDEPISENETKAMIRIFQEYENKGLMIFKHTGKRIILYQKNPDFIFNKKCLYLVRNLQKYTNYPLERSSIENKNIKITDTGSIEQYYAEVIRQPSLAIELSRIEDNEASQEIKYNKNYNDIKCLPLEYIFSLKES